jgi:hypothetical protein
MSAVLLLSLRKRDPEVAAVGDVLDGMRASEDTDWVDRDPGSDGRRVAIRLVNCDYPGTVARNVTD